MSGDPNLATWRVLWRSLVIGVTALFVAWHVAVPPPTQPHERHSLPPLPSEVGLARLPSPGDGTRAGLGPEKPGVP